ncbi:neurogenic locus notch homolog protein 1-like isoform X8 [Xenia sp. Carnegie-2017]|uniref:neurogenic locus notch homolog protein 1-like isoform X8 n=1 Tax=Xenia sp. Carnegie-2017 TaxID=2897299 RepID=UPI001F03C469|nr:neurogenic locus notch homolog protein 1-like isoform X8 [Xenia sp. Carnegie-2017]
MPTKDPGLRSCGTYGALWFRGIHPTTDNVIVDATACARWPFTLPTECGISYKIKVIKCGPFYLYRLKKPRRCNVAYCAGTKDLPANCRITTNGTICSDVNECLSNPCSQSATCIDNEGSYECRCNNGYSGNGFSCININECLSSPCNISAICIDTKGAFECRCRQGFSGNGFSCTNINECLSNPCNKSANCTDNKGSYECRCKEGYSGNGFFCTSRKFVKLFKTALVFFLRSFLVYLDIDECLSDPCNISANCTDTEGSFKCQCNEGFSGNGFSCTNMNECLHNPCDVNANCTDTEGSFKCQCSEGYSGNGFFCTNINECLSNPCNKSANCTDNKGSYECRCKEGYSGNGFFCTNVDECLSDPCNISANCTDTEGSFKCQCNEGFSGNGFSCTNMNECLHNPCDVNANCTDTEGSFDCQCSEGYSGNGFFCTNINECLSNPCNKSANCTDNKGSYECRCKEGYSGNGFFCTNVDECLSDPCNISANCTDTEGSFKCQCNEGFSGNGFSCTNMNECLHNPCDVKANCTDTEGSFKCQCSEGYSGNGFFCTNVDECLSDPCNISANCTDTEGSFKCQCNEGFSGNGFSCTNMNECLHNPCDVNANCTDTEGSFDCQCSEGYSGNGFFCTNINECLSNPCNKSANCTDNKGSYECRCKEGYSGNGFFCTNVDECLSDPCNISANCTDTEGSFKCQCNEGFSGNGFSCTNMNECLHNPCDVKANCTDTEGSFQCQCSEGYSGNGFFCTNINGCLSNPCNKSANCTDNKGSYECRCKEGYSGNGFFCTDVDECLSDPCNISANCTDTEGSFKCQCNEGFSGNGFSCTNMNECLHNPCDVNANCTDTEGSFKCQCSEGYSGNGFFCTNINGCLTNPCNKSANCTDNKGSYECRCNEGYSGNGFFCTNVDECLSDPCNISANCTDTEGSFKCQCNEGFSGNGFSCTNMNECLHNPCDVNANCTDTEGSFKCQCSEGYSGNGFFCTNINGCLTNPCNKSANCTDNKGSYECRCNEGYSGNGFFCTNVDECLSDPCNISANCTDTEGSFKCQCNEGFSGNGFFCTNMNECLHNPCDVNANCTDTEGSFQCQCSEGYSGNGFFCTNINGCLTNPCNKSANCTDNKGSYECRCKEGYSGNGFFCTNVDECLSDPCNISANCTDTEGSFKCQCNEGYTGNGHFCTNINECLSDPCKIYGKCTDSEGSYECHCRERCSDDDSFSVIMGIKYTGFAGGLLQITCRFNGPSTPSFVWKNGSQLLSFSERIKIETNGKISNLFVRKTLKTDSGFYHCIARKAEYIIYSNVSIKVKVAPVVSVFPHSISTKEDDVVLLTCHVLEGDEKNIEILWFNKSFPKAHMDRGRQLNLTNLVKLTDRKSFSEEYWCTAKNSDGKNRSQNVKVVLVSKGFTDFCSNESSGSYVWKKTPVGSTVVIDCGQNQIGIASRSCSLVAGNPKWRPVDISKCRSEVVVDLVDQVSRLDEGFASNVSEIIKKTETVTDVGKLLQKDVEDLVSILKITQNKTATQSDRENFIRSSSNIVGRGQRNVWKNIPERNTLARQIISGADLNAKKFVAESKKIGKVVSFKTTNIQVIGIKLPEKPKNRSKEIKLVDTGGQGVRFHTSLANGLQQATVVKYSSIKDILSSEELKKSVDKTIKSSGNLTIQSTILSFTTTPKLYVTQAIQIILKNNQSGFDDPKRECVFIEPDVNGSKWSGEGCMLNETESSEDSVICDCDHNTAFAIMMDTAGVKLTETEREILEYISNIGCSISLFGVVLTLLTHVLFWKHVKSPKSKVLLCLCIAIGFTDVFAILEGVSRYNPEFCSAVAALLHFFLLSVFGWMLCEGILLYIMLIRIFDGVRGKHWKIFNLIGWGVPLIIVSISLGATRGKGYGSDNSCWLSVESKLILAFIVPASLVITANTVVLFMVIYKVLNSHKVRQQENLQKVKTGLKATIVVLPLLGLTWLFGLMTFNRETIVFRYLFAIFNSAQGIFIFLFHCVLNKQMRDVVRQNTQSTFFSSLGMKKSSHSQNVSSSSARSMSLNARHEKTKSTERSHLEESSVHSNEITHLLHDNTDAFQSSTQSGIPKNNDHGMLKLDGKIVTNDESPNLLCLENIDEKASSVV